MLASSVAAFRAIPFLTLKPTSADRRPSNWALQVLRTKASKASPPTFSPVALELACFRQVVNSVLGALIAA